jgi:hypothetical protein
MSLFMDTHTIEGGVSAADVAQAHRADLETQDKTSSDAAEARHASSRDAVDGGTLLA